MDKTALPDEIVALFRKFGKQGGDTTKKRHGSKHFSAAGKIGMAKRWGKMAKATDSTRVIATKT
jgi:hypothetical protein